MKYLIINADDFGYCPKRDQAIIELYQKKSISSTSLLVNGMNVYQACLQAKFYHLPMGIHLNLTEGQPITNDFNRIQSLINSNGLMHGKIGLRKEFDKGNIQLEHVEYEIRMQLNRYQQLMNNQIPRHIDGHQHIHIHPMIVECVARIVQEYRIKYIRVPNDRMMIDFEENLFYKEIINQTKFAMEIFDKYSLIYSDYFFGMSIMGEKFTLENIEKCLKEIKKEENLLIELMCHPGYPSDPFIGGCGNGQPDEFSQSNDRRIEYDLLASNELKILLKKYNLQLCIDDYNFVNKDMLNDDEVNVDANHCE